MQRLVLLACVALMACQPARRGGSGGDSDDAYEPNDSASAAAEIACGDTIQATAADADWFTWTTGAAGPVSVQITWTDADAGLTVELISPDGQLGCFADGLSFDCEDDASAGTWQLGVIPLDDAEPDYGLSVDCVPGGDDDDDDDDLADDDDDDDATTNPAAFLVETHPEDGELGVFPGTDIWVEFDIPTSVTEFLVAWGSGEQVDGSFSSSNNGRVWTFEPDELLSPDWEYTAYVTWDGGDASFSFETSDIGGSVSPESAIVGNAFVSDFASATFVEPPGVGAIIQSQLSEVAMLCDVLPSSDLPGGELHYVLGLGEGNGPTAVVDPCVPTMQPNYGPDGVVGTADDEPATWNNPAFDLGPIDGVSIQMQGLPVTMNDVVMSGLFSPDATTIAGGVFAASIDTRPLVPLLIDDTEEDPGAVCDLMSSLGVSCEECGGDNPGVYCLSVLAENVEASSLGTPLPVRTCVDILDDEACGDEWSDYDEDGDGLYELCPGWSP